MTTDRSSFPRWTLPLALIALGAAGLFAVSLMSLTKLAERARATAEVEARKATAATARTLRLSSEEVDPTQFESTLQFEIRGDRLFVPSSIAWLDAPSTESIPDQLPTLVQQSLQEIRRQESEGRSDDATRKLLALAASSDLQRPESHWLALQAVFVAQRSGGDPRAILDTLDPSPLTDDAGPANPWNILGLLRVLHSLDREFPTWGVPRLAQVPTTILSEDALLDVTWGPDAKANRLRVAQLREQRETLRRARDWQRSGGTRLWSWQQGRIVVFRSSASEFKRSGVSPEGDRRQASPNGVGVVLPPNAAFAALRKNAGFDAETDPDLLPHFGDAADRMVAKGVGVPVVPGIALEPTVTDEETRPLSLFGIAGALAALFGSGLWLAYRSVRREREVLEQRSQFLTAVTHELKTPLASIRLHTEVLAQPRLDEARRQRYLEQLSAEERRVTLLIENLLEASAVDRGARGYDRRQWAIATLVHESVSAFKPLARRDNLELLVDLQDEEVEVQADRGAVVQVLLNLFENVRRYARDGGVCEVHGSATQTFYEIQVSDHGPGIPAEDRVRIFERFERGRSAQNEGNPGVGLGLYLSRRILEDLGGELTCTDRASGSGTTFILRLRRSRELEGSPCSAAC